MQPNPHPFSPGIIIRQEVEYLRELWRTWFIALWPGEPERAFVSYDAAERYLLQRKLKEAGLQARGVVVTSALVDQLRGES